MSAAGGCGRVFETTAAAIELLRLINARVRFIYCSASDLVDTTPELARIGRQPRRAPGSAGGGGTELETAPYNTGVNGTDTEVWVAVQAEMVGLQQIKFDEFLTAFSPPPGTVGKTSWPGKVIVGQIDEVKLQNGAGEDIAEGVFDPTLPNPGP